MKTLSMAHCEVPLREPHLAFSWCRKHGEGGQQTGNTCGVRLIIAKVSDAMFAVRVRRWGWGDLSIGRLSHTGDRVSNHLEVRLWCSCRCSAVIDSRRSGHPSLTIREHLVRHAVVCVGQQLLHLRANGFYSLTERFGYAPWG